MKIKFVFVMICLALAGCFAQGDGKPESSANVALSEAKKEMPTAMEPTVEPVIFGQEKKPDSIYIIFDASGSMAAQLPDKSRKIQAAKQVLQDFLARKFEGYELALRVYGHRRKEDCADSELLIPFNAPEKVMAELRQQISRINALGKTPITYSLTEALKDFGDRNGEIILISDGIESCNADPCALVREWRNRNVKIRVHVVGFGLEEKEQEALRCISAAAGTPYHNVDSAAALAAELAKIQEKTVATSFILQGFDLAGKALKVNGYLARDGKQMYMVSSSSASHVHPGDYALTAGVATQNGRLYQPTTQKVEVRDTGQTIVKVIAPIPPTVRARFTEQGETHGGLLIRAYQKGKEVFSFRSIDEVYLDEGTYEFRARPNSANHLLVTESFVAGDRKEIVFGLAHTVKVTVKMVASGSGEGFRENYELWQNGEKKYVVHQVNGAIVIAGIYDIVLPNRLTPFVKKGVLISNEKVQHFDITVPVGQVTFIYQKADGTRDKDDRCFVSPGAGNERIFRQSGVKHPFTAGRYNVNGWQQKGDYDKVDFVVQAGEDKTVVLRAKK